MPFPPCFAPLRPRCARLFISLAFTLLAPKAITSELQDLMSLLDEQTRLATRSRMNADYVPGMATVLNGSELRARGVRTVWEALALVPGISQGMEFTGERQVLSRGVGHGYASGQIKILLDGVSMNSNLLGTANPVMNMPIEQVERIEVIRGPGSSVHGEFAYAAVVDVITRSAERGVHLLTDEYGQVGAGAVWNWSDPQRDLAVSVNLMGLDTEGSDVQVAQDALYQEGLAGLSNAPGPSNEAARYRAAFLNLDWAGWFASAKWLDDAYGDHFGINHFLPPPDHHLASSQAYLILELGRELDLSDGLRARLKVESRTNDRMRDRMFVYPAGYVGPDPVYMDLDYRERRYLASAEIHWQPHPAHQWLFSLEGSRNRIDHASWEFYGLPPSIAIYVDDNWIDTELNRDIVSAVLQDQYRVADNVTLTGTVRYDDYSDVGAHASPRLAAVWRIDQSHILKAQYARAFRPPTFYEIYYAGGDEIEPSKIDTFELGYILKHASWEGHLTLFQSELDGPIAFDELGSGGYINDRDARLRGAELELQQRLGSRFKIDANLSYVDAVYRDDDTPLPGGTHWLGNLGLLWQPLERWTGALQLKYVGERSRSSQDPRPPLEGYTTLDLTLGYETPREGPWVRFGVKNLTDEEVRYPDQLTTDYAGNYFLNYPDDYPRPGRHWWLSLGYRF